MIAHAGLLSYRMGYSTPLEETECTQRCVRFAARPANPKLIGLLEQVPN